MATRSAARASSASARPDELILALERRFLERGPALATSPSLFAAAPGDGKDRGLNRLAHAGLLKRAVGGHWSLVPKLGELALDNAIEAYNLPLGCISHLYREIAGARARHPDQGGASHLRRSAPGRRQAQRASRPKTSSSVIEIEGETWLLYKAFPINVALIRGTTADPAGNITMEREALELDNLAHRHGGQELAAGS